MPNEDKSVRFRLMIFRVTNMIASSIITHKLFESITIIVIVSNSVMLALENPADKTKSKEIDILE